ncbi:3-keto-disaccharide hydrolase [Rubrivirga sp.]|uniref:3-keto-disaccharide hydrolase n=1 Tax=Rubrivirga sp. TaxID=1885344 RepID=UPI003C75ABD7
MRLASFLLLLPLVACGGMADQTARAVLEDGEADGWTDLFDGATLEGWHGYATDEVSDKWSVQDGVMILVPDGGDWDGDLVAPGGPYGDFALEVEWAVQECGNSGIFYRGEESADLAPIWRTALEAQILDDSCHPDGQYPSHRVGGLYDLYVPEPGAERPGGAWNTTRIVADGDRLEHWLNGRLVLEAEQGSDDWNARLAVSKFRDADTFPAYGTRRTGIIGIQDHGDTLRVRAVRIRSL